MLKRFALLTLFCAAVLFPVIGCGGSDTTADASTGTGGGGSSTLTPAEITAYEDEVWSIVNNERSSEGLPSLTRDPELDAIAQGHSDHMRNVGTMAHDGIGDGTVSSRYADAGYTCIMSGENVARGQSTPAAVMNAWMNSPGHRANILNSNFNRIGIGLAMPGFYWTQNFAKK